MDELKLIREYMELTGCSEQQARSALAFLESRFDRENSDAEERPSPGAISATEKESEDRP